jgi:hypothetical protein
MTRQRRALDQLRKTAKTVGVPWHGRTDMFSRFDEIVDHIKRHPEHLLNGVLGLSSFFCNLTPSKKLLPRQIIAADNLLSLWDKLPSTTHIQALGASLEMSNISTLGLIQRYGGLGLYLHQLVDEFCTTPPRSHLISSREAFNSYATAFHTLLPPNTLVYYALISLLPICNEFFSFSSNFGSLDTTTFEDKAITHSLEFTRRLIFMESDALSTAYHIERSELWALCMRRLQRLNAQTPRALVTALHLLNEILLHNLVVDACSLSAPDMSKFSKEAIELFSVTTKYEIMLWETLNETARADEASAYFAWPSVFFFPPDDDNWSIVNLIVDRLIENDIGDLKQFLSSRPLTTLLLARLAYFKHESINTFSAACCVKPESILATTHDVLCIYSANPASLDYDAPHRAAVRAELFARPPAHYLVASNVQMNISGTAALLCGWWLNTRLALGAIGEARRPYGRSFLDWKRRLRRSAVRAAEVPGEHLFDEGLVWTTSFDEQQAALMGLVNVPFPPFERFEEEEFSRFFRWEREIQSRDGDNGMKEIGLQAVNSLCAEAEEYAVDLLFAGLDINGPVFLYFSQNNRKWHHCGGPSFINRPTLFKSLDKIRKDSLLRVTQRDELFNFDLIWHPVVGDVFSQLPLGPRISVILSPEFQSSPLVSIVASRIYKLYGDESAIGEIDLGAFVKYGSFSTREANVQNKAFLSFVDSDLVSNEIRWSDWGWQGKIVSRFGPTDILNALESQLCVLHFVMHGHLNRGEPVLSFLLTPKGPLFAFELMERDIAVRLLVINSCSSTSEGLFCAPNACSVGRVAVMNGAEVVLGNVFPINTATARKAAITFQSSLAGLRRSPAHAFTRSIGTVSDEEGATPPVAIFGRSIRTLFSQL